MMNRSIARKSTLREADRAYFLGESPRELLAVHAELTRVALLALGLENAPMLRSVARKVPFREFVAQPFPPFPVGGVGKSRAGIGKMPPHQETLATP